MRLDAGRGREDWIGFCGIEYFMKTIEAEDTYRVWACDNQVYGPIEMPILIEWVQDGRVLAGTWVYSEAKKEWLPAKKLASLHKLFPPGEETAFLQQRSFEESGVTPQELRQVAILATLSNAALAQVIRFGELQCLKAGELVIKRNDPGDALFFILSGTLRARLVIGLEDRTLARIPAGEVFGEMAMFTQSPRSADVVCEDEARLLRLGADAFRQLIAENLEAAAPMLFAIARMMANRIKDQNSRFQLEAASEFLWR